MQWHVSSSDSGGVESSGLRFVCDIMYVGGLLYSMRWAADVHYLQGFQSLVSSTWSHYDNWKHVNR